MPYFVYNISANKELKLLKSFDSYRDAKEAATTIRMESPAKDNRIVRIVFAQDPVEAEELLKTKRERQPSEDDPI